MIDVAIVGGTGYTGSELLRLLAGHGGARVTQITSRSESGRKVAELFPNFWGRTDLVFSEPEAGALAAADVVFFATPHGVAQSMAGDLLERGARIIDLSADFRLRDVATWEHWYGQPHQAPQWIEAAVYGLPEVARTAIAKAQLVACPGCYPTAVQLGFLPLLEANCVRADGLIASAASGISGAGRQAKMDLLFAEVTGSFKSYGVGGHRHLPEIEQGLAQMLPAGTPLSLTFVPHLLPIARGIHATLFAPLLESGLDLQTMFEQRYADEPFVDVLPAGRLPQTRAVAGTNRVQIAVTEPQGRGTAVVLVVEDNLTKGAAGQAVQCMNIMFGIDEAEGLRAPALLPYG